jgi:hypothetical protein
LVQPPAKKKFGSILKLPFHFIKTASENFSYGSSSPLLPFPIPVSAYQKKERDTRKRNEESSQYMMAKARQF